MPFKNTRLRNLVQLAFAIITVYIGLRFVLFVHYYSSQGTIPGPGRPPAVEAFLPISALVAFKAWLSTGVFDPIHPAGLTILLTILLLSLVFKKAFCSWICPIGTLSEGLARLGKFFFGRTFRIPKLLDYPLRSLKYLLFFFFFSAVFLSMSGQAALAFLSSDYNKVADVKMLLFFQNLSATALWVIGALFILSIFFEHFWCRYLCPYGALLGLISALSPWKVSRDKEACIDCGACDRACPNSIEITGSGRVWSPECNGCLNCVNACPVTGAVEFKTRLPKSSLNPKYLAVTLIVLWLAAVLLARISNHWETLLTPETYSYLIPRADYFSH